MLFQKEKSVPALHHHIFDRTCEIRRNFDHELVKKLVETEYNPMTPVVEDEEEDAFFIH